MKKIVVKSILVFAFFISVLEAKEPLSVTILPQKYIVQKIVKDKFDVNVMVAPGSSPHNFEPKPSNMKALFNSKAYFKIGEPSEKAWIEKFKQNAKNTIFVDTTIGIEKMPMKAHFHEEVANNSSEHKEHKHEAGELDPHIWLEPNLVKIQAKNIYEAMIKIDEENSSFYKQNFEEFEKELTNLDLEIKSILKPYENRAFMVFHPSWGYFATSYFLEQIAVENMAKEPKPNELINLIKEAKAHNVKVVFVSPQFSQKTSKTISQNIGANVVAIDPLSDDWSNNLLNVAKQIAKSYE